jgi:hypothetical protein
MTTRVSNPEITIMTRQIARHVINGPGYDHAEINGCGQAELRR